MVDIFGRDHSIFRQRKIFKSNRCNAYHMIPAGAFWKDPCPIFDYRTRVLMCCETWESGQKLWQPLRCGEMKIKPTLELLPWVHKSKVKANGKAPLYIRITIFFWAILQKKSPLAASPLRTGMSSQRPFLKPSRNTGTSTTGSPKFPESWSVFTKGSAFNTKKKMSRL